jgi:hypothetical protein
MELGIFLVYNPLQFGRFSQAFLRNIGVIFRTPRHYILGDSTRHSQHSKNLQSYKRDWLKFPGRIN